MSCRKASEALLKSALVLSLACVFLGCITDRRAASSVDSWINPLPLLMEEVNETPLARSQFCPVSESKESEAESRLDGHEVVQVTEDDAAMLTNHGLQPVSGTKPFLVRGLYLNWGTGRFEVRVLRDHDVYVFHGCLGKHAVPMKRRALVLRLEHVPRHVYVDCGMAE